MGRNWFSIVALKGIACGVLHLELEAWRRPEPPSCVWESSTRGVDGCDMGSWGVVGLERGVGTVCLAGSRIGVGVYRNVGPGLSPVIEIDRLGDWKVVAISFSEMASRAEVGRKGLCTRNICGLNAL